MRDGFSAEQGRRLAARDQCRGDDDIGLLGALVYGLGLALHPAGRHRPGIAANPFGALTFLVGFVRHVEELGAQRLDLLLDCGAYIRGFDHGAHAFGGGNGLQACNAGAQNQHTGSLHGTGGGHQHGHEARVVMRCQQHRLVTSDVGLGRQHVEALCPRGTRRRFKGEGGDTAFGHLADHFAVERVEHAHQEAAAVYQRELLIVGRDHFEYELRAVGVGGASQGGPHDLIGTVRNAGV
ncbi:hypothetical protein D3C81_1493510 [compost metagenome]